MNRIPSLPGYYATEEGFIFSEKSGRLLCPKSKNGWYLGLKVLKNGKYHGFRVHRLVAEAFIPNPDGLAEVNHKNGVKTDNRVDNLEWTTRSKNIIHSYRILKRNRSCGETHPKSKIVIDLRTGIFYPCIREIAEARGISRATAKGYLRNKKHDISYC